MPETVDRRFRVFLCHSSNDKPVVRGLFRKLAAEGWIDVWLDEEKLFPGQDWNLEIEKAVEAADAILVCLSNDSITKEGYIQRDLRIVLDYANYKPEGTLYLIPIRLENCELPRRLRSWQYADYFPEPDREQAYQRLLVSLHMRADSLGISISKPMAVKAKANSAKQNKEAVWPPNVAEKPTLIMPNRATFGGLDFVLVPAGPFLMGSSEESELNDDDEIPQHTVDIPYDYWLGRFPVTNEQYQAFVEASGKEHPVSNWEQKRTHPVSNIHWQEHAQAYVKWLNDSQGWQPPQGLVFRLPTEAEWEKAARGEDGRVYPWGNEFDKDKCNSSKITKPVGLFSPHSDSSYGCADMTSNVWEWTLSLKKPYPYKPRTGREDLHALGARALRGGYNDNLSAHCAYRSIHKAISLFENLIGFRVAVSLNLY